MSTSLPNSVAFCSLAAVPGALKLWGAEAVVSAFSPRRAVARLSDRPHFRLDFHDIEAPAPGRVGATAGQIGAFIDWLDTVRGRRLLIHCDAGSGRAPALAIAAAVARGNRQAAIFERLAPYRAVLRPNRLVLHLADHRLGLGGTLVAAATTAFAAGYSRGRLVVIDTVIELCGD